MVLIYSLQTCLVINQPVGVEVMDLIANQRRFRSGNAETTVLDFMSKGKFERIHERFYMEDLNEIVKLVFVLINLLKPICKHLFSKHLF
jgi:hypothetical protein